MKGDLHMLMMLPKEKHGSDEPADEHDSKDLQKAMTKCADDMIHAFKSDDADALFSSLCDFLDMHKDYERDEEQE